MEINAHSLTQQGSHGNAPSGALLSSCIIINAKWRRQKKWMTCHAGDKVRDLFQVIGVTSPTLTKRALDKGLTQCDEEGLKRISGSRSLARSLGQSVRLRHQMATKAVRVKGTDADDVRCRVEQGSQKTRNCERD